MNVLTKLKETAVSVIPVILIVLLLGFTVVPVEKIILARFVIGGLFLIAGLTVFLIGVDLGIQPMGERCGAELTKKRSIVLLLVSAFFIGFIVTAAEPDIQVFASQVQSVFPFINRLSFTFVIASGVGVFILTGLLRSVLNFSLKITFFILYTVLFILTFFIPSDFAGIAFDSGGATTGPMTVPFIMALGLGVCSVRSDDKNSFGLTGISSVGPVMAVLVFALCYKSMTGGSVLQSVSSNAVTESEGIFSSFGMIIPQILKESLVSILPLFVLFIIFQITLLKLSKIQIIRMVIGFFYSFTGLALFLTGAGGGFSQAGREIGFSLAQKALNMGGWWTVLLVVTGFVFGAIIVCAEPAVWVLSEQVEHVSGGTIKRKILLVFLSLGTAAAVALSILRIVNGLDLKIILIPGYVISLLLMIFCPTLFSGIAFDSGGVASGPLTSTFVLSFTIGISSAFNTSDSFGVIALVAMMPLIAIQIMGIIFRIKSRRSVKEVK
ncbi:MAG: DUF1538 domain-containing protein [Treponema sp.]|nr:DUF1538 domain-containing protein [Treponema sp.]